MPHMGLLVEWKTSVWISGLLISEINHLKIDISFIFGHKQYSWSISMQLEDGNVSESTKLVSRTRNIPFVFLMIRETSSKK